MNIFLLGSSNLFVHRVIRNNCFHLAGENIKIPQTSNNILVALSVFGLSLKIPLLA